MNFLDVLKRVKQSTKVSHTKQALKLLDWHEVTKCSAVAKLHNSVGKMCIEQDGLEAI